MYKLVVLSCLLAAALAEPSAVGLGWAGLGVAGPLGWGGVAGPLGWGGVAGPLGWGAPLGVAAPWGAAHVGGVGVAPAIAAYNYRGPLSLNPGQPANIVAADGRPLDTLSVNLDRAAHITAKAVTGGIHVLKKRSAPLIAAPLAVSHTARVDWPSAALYGPALAAPLAWGGHAAPLAWGGPIAPLGLGPLGHGARLGVGPWGLGHW